MASYVGAVVDPDSSCFIWHCRGVAKFAKKGTVPQDTCRMVWGNGVRAGMYPLSEDEAYWFTCFNASANVS